MSLSFVTKYLQFLYLGKYQSLSFSVQHGGEQGGYFNQFNTPKPARPHVSALRAFYFKPQKKRRANDKLNLTNIYFTCLVEFRLQNSRFFSSKSVKKSVKRAVRVLRARSALASHAPQVSLFVFSLVLDLLFDCSRVAYLNTQKYGLFCSLS